MKRANKSDFFWGGVMLGSAIGAGLAVFFTSDKAKVFSSRMKRSSNEFIDHLKVKFHCLLEEMKDEISAVTEKANDFMRIEQSLNAKILKLTLKIQDEYPALYQHIEEMPVTIPDETNPEITLKNLNNYFNSLDTLLKKYILESSKLPTNLPIT